MRATERSHTSCTMTLDPSTPDFCIVSRAAKVGLSSFALRAKMTTVTSDHG